MDPREERVLALLGRPSGASRQPAVRLVAAMQPREYRENETIVREGDPAVRHTPPTTPLVLCH